MDLFNQINHVLEVVNTVLWSLPTFAVLIGVGLLFSVWSKFVQFRALTHGVSVLRGKYDREDDPGAINHFQALSAALSGTVGLGNIGGVAMAIGVGGPGALFWMWMAGFFGMAIKAVEVTLAMLYRDTTNPEDPHGGAMYVVTRGWGDRVGGAAKPFAKVVGAIFCVTLLISAATGGNMFQAWNVADITNSYFGVNPLISGLVLATLTALVILGGIRRIGDVAGYLVPFMCGLYLIAGIVVLFVEAANVPGYLALIVREAFNPTEAAGAFLGGTMGFGLTTGLRRALFSNEAGQGTSPIAHSAAKTDEPAREGIVAALEPFIDTCLVCTLTALVILCTDTWNRPPFGEFGGEIALVQAEGSEANSTWNVEAPTDLENLPKLVFPDSWETGNGFFLVAEAPENRHRDQGSNRLRVEGQIAVAKAGDDSGFPPATKYIAWSPIELSNTDWDHDVETIRLVDRGIHRNLLGAALTGYAFDRAIPGLGRYLVTTACWLFALSTLISWSYYGEQGTIFLFGKRSVPAYKVIYCLLTVAITYPGLISNDQELGNLSDLGTGCMLWANVPIIVLMGHRAILSLSDYQRRLRSGAIQPPQSTNPSPD